MTIRARIPLAALLVLTFAVCAAPAVKGAPSDLPQAVEAAPTQPKIVLYSTSWCPHCKEAKEYFRDNKISFINRDVEQDGDAMEALVEKYMSRAVPVIVIGDDEKILKGFKREEFEKAFAEAQKKK